MRASLKLSAVAGLTGCALIASGIQSHVSNSAIAAKNVDSRLLIAAKPQGHKPAAAAPSNQTLIKTANSFVDLLAASKFEQSTTYLAPGVKSVLPAPKLQLAWQALTMQYGAYKLRKTPNVEPMGSATSVVVPVVFGTETLDVRVVFAGSAKVAGFFVEPHKGDFKEASYVSSGSYSEQKVKVGNGKWQLDGVLTLPNGDGPFPGVVLVHGSGPHDMDETIGPNKPFRDLAHGLASKGIAVIRYEKRTKQHSKSLIGPEFKTLTIKEETVDDAVEAAKVLRSNPKIDKSKIVVLGHSLGGTAVPRIAQADQDIGGFILMAGGNEPMETAIVRQAEYIAGLGNKSAAATKQLDMLKATAAKVKGVKPADAGSNTVILGASPAYWLDLKAHDPLEEIKAVNRPILFLQGGRDYQVTADGDYERWKAAVKAAGHEAQCEFKLYPQLNHLFSSGTGKCTPNEYMKRASNVDEAAVNDISSWVKGLNSAG